MAASSFAFSSGSSCKIVEDFINNLSGVSCFYHFPDPKCDFGRTKRLALHKCYFKKGGS